MVRSAGALLPPTATSNSADGGGGEIRTREPREELPVFKTGAFNRSATPPGAVPWTNESGRRLVESPRAVQPDGKRANAQGSKRL